MQGIPIDPDRAVLSSLSMAAAILKSGQSLVWFPEGRRTLTGDLQQFKGGIGILLERFPEATIVPVFLKNTGKALAPGSWIIHPVKLEVIFGSPRTSTELDHSGTGKSPHERIVSALYNAVWELDPRHQGHPQSPPERNTANTNHEPAIQNEVSPFEKREVVLRQVSYGSTSQRDARKEWPDVDLVKHECQEILPLLRAEVERIRDKSLPADVTAASKPKSPDDVT